MSSPLQEGPVYLLWGLWHGARLSTAGLSGPQRAKNAEYTHELAAFRRTTESKLNDLSVEVIGAVVGAGGVVVQLGT